MRARDVSVQKTKVLIIGLGNSIAGDDGFGSYMVDFLGQAPLPYGVRVLEGGTDAFALLPELEKTERVILIDVIQTGESPGTIYRIPLDQLVNASQGFSQHDISLITLYQLPFSKWHLNLPDGVLFAMEAGEVELFCEELNPELKKMASVLAERIRKEIQTYIGTELYPLS